MTRIPTSSTVLVLVASIGELRAVAPGSDAVQTLPPSADPTPPGAVAQTVLSGIGKSNAAASLALNLRPHHALVVNLGIAGALPGAHLRTAGESPQDRPLSIGDVVIATHSVFADEGIETPDGFQDCDDMGFPLGDFPHGRVPNDDALARRALAALATSSISGVTSGAIATVSTCSGTDARAQEIARRTGAIAECMEGAAIAAVCRTLHVPFLEIRVISNTTGDRPRQVWNISRAFSVLGEVSRAVLPRLARD